MSTTHTWEFLAAHAHRRAAGQRHPWRHRLGRRSAARITWGADLGPPRWPAVERAHVLPRHPRLPERGDEAGLRERFERTPRRGRARPAHRASGRPGGDRPGPGVTLHTATPDLGAGELVVVATKGSERHEIRLTTDMKQPVLLPPAGRVGGGNGAAGARVGVRWRGADEALFPAAGAFATAELSGCAAAAGRSRGVRRLAAARNRAGVHRDARRRRWTGPRQRGPGWRLP